MSTPGIPGASPVRSVFYGFGAWVGSLNSATTCQWWPDDPNEAAISWDRKKLIEVDLDRTPSAFRSRQILVEDIQVDDKASDGGLTRLGPTWPTGSTINGIWLESMFYDRLPDEARPPRIPRGLDCNDYELTSVEYWSGPLATRRFYGFFAEINTATRGTMALCEIYPAGHSRGGRPEGAWWLDLAQVAHPIEKGFTEIGVDPQDLKRGALFLDSLTVKGLKLSAPKLPPFQGSNLYP
jgi:hypothetical protein